MVRPDHGYRGGILTFVVCADAYCFVGLLDLVRPVVDGEVTTVPLQWNTASMGYVSAILVMSLTAWFAGGYADLKARIGARSVICGLPLIFLALFINKSVSE